MITAVDTSVLIDILSADPVFGPRSRAAIRAAAVRGRVVACDVVWAEVAGWGPSREAADDVLARMGIGFVPMTQVSALTAGSAFQRYRRSGGLRERVLPDFLIGAHAMAQADRLLTRDRGFHRRYFEDLVVIDPSET